MHDIYCMVLNFALQSHGKTERLTIWAGNSPLWAKQNTAPYQDLITAVSSSFSNSHSTNEGTYLKMREKKQR